MRNGVQLLRADQLAVHAPVLITLAFALGSCCVLIAQKHPLSGSLLLCLLASTLSVLLTRRRWRHAACLLLAFLIIGTLMMRLHQAAPWQSYRKHLTNRPTVVTIHGVAVPRMTET